MKWLACHVLGVKREDLGGVRYRHLVHRMNEFSKGDRVSGVLDLLPSLAAILLIPLWVRLAKQFPVMWRFAFEGSFALCVVVYLHWLLRRRYTRHGWRALRDLGYADVCPRCGYDLSRHPQPEGACPECGESFSRFHPAQSDSTTPP